MGGGLFYVNQFVSFTTFFYVCCALTDLSPAYRSRLSYRRTIVWLRSGSKHFYCPQRNCGKVMFLHLSVILFTGGVSRTTPWVGTPPGRHTIPQADTPLGRHLPPPRRPPQWMVRILLECILVFLLPFETPKVKSSILAHLCLMFAQLFYLKEVR